MKRLVRQSLSRIFKANFLILVILSIGILFRTYHFSSNPPSLNWDEVSIGYNANSILHTGKDEFGTKLPLYFRSLDDYKMPVYVYLTSLSIAVFGYTDIAVRFTSLFFGVLTIYLVYLLSQQLFQKKSVALFSAFCVAVMPWNIAFSRMAAEANVALAFTLIAILLFLKGVVGRQKLLWISVFFFGLASYTYLSFRIVAPLVGLGMFIVNIKQFISNRKLLISVLIPAIIVGVLLLRDVTGRNALARFSGTNFFSHSSELLEINEKEMKLDGLLGINIPRRLIHDSLVLASASIITRAYLSHFSADYLIFGIGHKQESSIYSGLMYVWMIPFILYGLYMLFQTQKKESYAVVLLLLFIAPIPASVTWDVPHAIRTIALSVPLCLLAGLGMHAILERSKTIKSFYIYILCLAIMSGVIGSEVFVFFHQYFVHIPVERSQLWQYSYKEMTNYVESVKHTYDKIIISTRLEWPYAFTLYYSKYDPAAYLAQGGTRSGGWSAENNRYDNYEFRRIDIANDMSLPNTLLVGNPDDFSGRKDFVRAFYFLNGKPSIYVFETQGEK